MHAVDFGANWENEEFEVRAERLDSCHGTVEELDVGRNFDLWIRIEDIC